MQPPYTLARTEPFNVKALRAMHSALEHIQPRVVSFEEQVAVLREALARLYEAEEDYTQAAHTLAGIDLDSGGCDWGGRGGGGRCQS